MLLFRGFEVFIDIGQNALDGGVVTTKPLPTHDNTKQGKCRHIFMLRVRFEPAIPMLRRQKTVHALHCVGIVVGSNPHGERAFQGTAVL
jgi:hypothetical protein